MLIMQEKYQIFISYRRDGGDSLARLLEYKLTDRGFKVFLDVESLRSGDFNKALFERIAECTIVLVVLPPHGLDRCSDPKDWVRLEIAHALKLEKTVIPIMMRNFKFPDILPEDIDALRHQQAIEANHEEFEAKIERLVSYLKEKIEPLNSDEHLQKEAEAGNISAMNTIGLRYEFGSESLVKDLQKAFSFYKEAAESGDIYALYNLGDVYEKCERDLSFVYDYGIEHIIFKKNADDARRVLHELAVDCYTKAKDKDSSFAPAVYRLANLAEEAKDFENALKFYESAADLNYPAAHNALGYFKKNGIGGKNIDLDAAIAHYKTAADAGYQPAVYNYARAIELRDVDKAIPLYKSVVNDIPQAAFSLAKLYEYRLNDLRLAINHYRVAYEAGIQEAKECLKRCQDKFFGKNDIKVKE